MFNSPQDIDHSNPAMLDRTCASLSGSLLVYSSLYFSSAIISSTN